MRAFRRVVSFVLVLIIVALPMLLTWVWVRSYRAKPIDACVVRLPWEMADRSISIGVSSNEGALRLAVYGDRFIEAGGNRRTIRIGPIVSFRPRVQSIMRLDDTNHIALAGFALIWRPMTPLGGGRLGDLFWQASMHGISLPMWFVVAMSTAVAARTVWPIYKSYAIRRLPTSCRHCGYDLRSGHEKCPECGAESHVKTTVTPRVQSRSDDRQ